MMLEGLVKFLMLLSNSHKNLNAKTKCGSRYVKGAIVMLVSESSSGIMVLKEKLSCW
jgi:hypothetical protein